MAVSIELVAGIGAELRMTSEEIAERSGVQHKNVLALAKKYGHLLDEFGAVHYETRARLAGQHGGGAKRI